MGLSGEARARIAETGHASGTPGIAGPAPGSIRSVNGTGYKLLGLAVWRGGKWYLRKRIPSRRKLVLVGAGGATAAAGAAVLARRLAS
jgi:hypothetical protein